jgi:hypothetical protein
MTEKRDGERTGDDAQHVDESKIGGVAHQHPDWGKEYRIDPERKPTGAENENRTGTPETTAPKRER